MASAQSGIFAAGTSSHCFLEFASRPETAALELVQALADLEEPHTTVGGANLVLGVRPTIWTQVAPDKLPVHASDFYEPIRGVGGFTMPATQQDAWVWVSGAAPDLVFDVCVDIVGRWRRWRRWRPRSPAGPTGTAAT